MSLADAPIPDAETTKDPLIDWPLRECEPWCDSDHTGHLDQHPDDRSCWSPFMPFKLSLAEPVEMSNDRWVHNWMDVLLHRYPKAEQAFIALFAGEVDFEFRLTPDEAEQLAGKLTHLAAVVRGDAQLDETVAGRGR